MTKSKKNLTEQQLRAHFGVISDDARLQRPEYIGGSSSPIVIGEVLQTSQTDTTPLGEMGGRAISSGMGMTDPYYAKEHGWIIGVVSIMPEALYMQGLPRKLSRLDKFDYYFPMFAHLGEQAVKNKEIFYSGNLVTNEETFGYQSRYAELRDIPSTIHGQFKTSLDYWHMGRIFSSPPPLDGQFISCEPSYRVFADTDGDASIS